jgi:hypothetical protein
MRYKTVSREVFIIYFAIKDFAGDVQEARKAVLEIEVEIGLCDFAIPADVAL